MIPRPPYDREDFAGLGADHGEAEDAIVARADHCAHEALFLIGRFRSQDLAHGQLSNADGNALALRPGVGQADAGAQWRIGEHDVRNLPIAGPVVSAGHMSATILKSSTEIWENCGLPAHSPIAQTP
jgi:hypothetical protein